MTRDLKLIIAFLSTIFMAVLIYFGSLLPLQKSRLYIKAITGSSQIHSVQEFNTLFNRALDFYSPVGHGEAVYAYLNVLVSTMQNIENRQVVEILLKEADKRMEPFLAADKGASYFQNLYTYGLIYELAGTKFKELVYYQKAMSIYETASRHSPGRQNLLYGLFRTNNALGNAEKAGAIAEIIAKYWPGAFNQ